MLYGNPFMTKISNNRVSSASSSINCKPVSSADLDGFQVQSWKCQVQIFQFQVQTFQFQVQSQCSFKVWYQVQLSFKCKVWYQVQIKCNYLSMTKQQQQQTATTTNNNKQIPEPAPHTHTTRPVPREPFTRLERGWGQSSLALPHIMDVELLSCLGSLESFFSSAEDHNRD